MTARAGEAARPPQEVNPLAHDQPAFAHTLGVRITHLSRERVAAELVVRAEFANRNDVLHGGVVMALAENLGGTAATANLTDGARTATIESKTNFFAASKSATPRLPNARRCTAGAPPWCGRPRSPAATAGSSRS